MAPYIYALIIFSIGAAALAEVLVEREKRQMKKQFLEELDKGDSKKVNHGNDERPAS